MGPPGDFDLAVLILRVLEAWELGKGGLYRKYRSYKKIIKSSKFDFGPGIFKIFSRIFTRKIRDTGISSETTIPGISSETLIPGIPLRSAIPLRAGFLIAARGVLRRGSPACYIPGSRYPVRLGLPAQPGWLA